MQKTLLALTLFTCAFYSIAQNIPDSVRIFAEQKIQEYAKDYPGVSVSISLDGKIAWNKSIGYRNLETKEPVTSDTKFNIYSTSKFITGLAYLKLAHTEGIEIVDRKVREIDPTLPESYKDITIRHLLNHTSGIRHYTSEKDWIQFSDLRCNSPAEALEHFINDPLTSVPGEKESYTTFGLTLASHLLGKLTGLKYQDALNELVPFTQELLLDNENSDKAIPYVKAGTKFKVVENLSAECKYGGGGLIASSDQLVEAGQILYDESFIPLDDVKEMLKSQYPEGETAGVSFAMASRIYEDGNLRANMGGASPGGRSFLMVLAKQKVAVAITTNCEGDGDVAFDLAFALAKKFAGSE